MFDANKHQPNGVEMISISKNKFRMKFVSALKYDQYGKNNLIEVMLH